MLHSLFALMLGVAGTSTIADSGALRTGSAMVDITPEPVQVADGDTIRDPLFIRAIVVRQGADRVVLVGADQGGFRGTIL